MRKLRYKEAELMIELIKTPKRVILLMEQQPGKVFETGLAVGDKVKRGQKVGEAPDASTPGIHSPIAGEVKETIPALTPEGHHTTAVVIEGGEADSEPIRGDENFLSSSAEELQSRLLEAGVGALGFKGTACFAPPLSVKVKREIETLIISAIDEEPILMVNQQIVREHNDELRTGVELVRRVTGAKKVVVATTPALQPKVGEHAVAIEPVYPNALPQMLIWRITGRPVYNGEEAKDKGYAVLSAETVVSMVRALRDGIPVMEKVVTVQVEASGPRNLRVPIGTPLSEVLKAVGCTLVQGDRVIMGGPMRGMAQFDPHMPVTKSTDAIVHQRGHSVTRYLDMACIGCGACVKVCPMKIQVDMMTRYCEYSLLDKAKSYDLDACIECGLCAFVCRAKRPLLQFILFAKNEIQRQEEELLEA